jgi:hypothetical protein
MKKGCHPDDFDPGFSPVSTCAHTRIISGAADYGPQNLGSFDWNLT